MSNKLTTTEFVRRSEAVHGNKYDYSEVQYTTTLGKVVIKCNKHQTTFEQIASSHLRGQGCPKCGVEATNLKNTKTTLDFITKASVIHTTKYDYTNTTYVNALSLVAITCPHHGVFHQKAIDHLSGNGCSQCGNNRTRAKYLQEPTILYYIYLPDQDVYKIGITLVSRGVKERFSGTNVPYTILSEEYFISGKFAYEKEHSILSKYSNYKYTGAPIFKNGGTSECFTRDILNLNRKHNEPD